MHKITLLDQSTIGNNSQNESIEHLIIHSHLAFHGLNGPARANLAVFHTIHPPKTLRYFD